MDTASFTDPIFLATYGLNRITVLDYFLHPLNPFRTKSKCCNDILLSQQISIGFIMQNGIGMRPGPLTLSQAEEEFRHALSRLQGEQYELLPVVPQVGTGQHLPKVEAQEQEQEQAKSQSQIIHPAEAPGSMHLHSPLFTIRHVYRSSETKVTPLGIYYVVEGIIYKSPTARSLMKASIARTTKGLIDACHVLRQCQNYSPRTGYYWDFDGALVLDEAEEEEKKNVVESHKDENDNVLLQDLDETEVEADIEVEAQNMARETQTDMDGLANTSIRSMNEILQDYKLRVSQINDATDSRSPHVTGSHRSSSSGSGGNPPNEYEEEGIRATDKINSILYLLQRKNISPPN